MSTTKAHAERFARALESTGLAQVVTNTHAENRINVLCRVSAENESKWTALIKDILVATETESGQAYAWASHICRTYFLKEMDNKEKKLVWGWNVSIQSLEMSYSLDAIIKIIKGESIRDNAFDGEITEFPLPGATINRNRVKPGGKGVRPLGSNEYNPAKSKEID